MRHRFCWGGEQADAASTEYEASIYDKSGTCLNSYAKLQDALNEVRDGQEVRLRKNIVKSKELVIDKKGVKFKLNLNGYTITGTKASGTTFYVLHIVNGDVSIRDSQSPSRQGGVIGKYTVDRCFRIDSGSLTFNVTKKTCFKGGEGRRCVRRRGAH